MFLKQIPQANGRVKLAIYESYRDGRRTRQRTVKSLGYLDELMDKHDDPVAWGKDIAAKMTKAKRESEQAISIEIYPKQKIDKKSQNVKNVGCAVLLSQYVALGIGKALRSASRTSKAKYSLDAICRLLVCERIIDPGSKLCAWSNKDRYFFRCDFSSDDVYRGLDGIARAKDVVVSSINRQITRAGVRDMSAVYYDVTNYYFETDIEDDLRRKGLSKEHRPNPIVQMGLLQDASGIPIAYRKFCGNEVDCTTLIPVLTDMKKCYDLDRVVTVADKGINSSINIAATIGSGDGFVFSQSIRGTKSDKALKKWVLDDTGYTYNNKDSSTFKFKSKQGFKTVHLKACDTYNNKAKDIKVEVKYVAFWSQKHARKTQHERQKVIDKAKKLVANPSAYTKTTSYGAAQYIKNLAFDKKTGEIVDGHKLQIDWDAIAEAEKYDGYYLIVTSETTWDDKHIIDTYRELWKIEESFKITKSELATRPVYVWTPDHIEAHFLICYIALVILRLLQLGSGLPCSKIREEIASMNCINLDTNWWVCGHRSDESDRLVETVGLEELKLKNLRTLDVRKLLAKAAKGEIPHKK